MSETNAVVEYMQHVLREIAYLDVEADEPLVIESLVAAEVKWRVDIDLDADVPLEDYLRGMTLNELALLIGARMPEGSIELEGWRT
jgi:hypothetical protein